MPMHRSVDKGFFKTWNDDMAYILGLLFADGNIVTTRRGTKYFALYSMDKALVAAVRDRMKATQKLSRRSERSGNVYRLQIGSKDMVEDLYRLGLEEGKARRMRFPPIPEPHIPHFIRGYFDGDGNVWVGAIHQERTVSSKTILVSFTSASAYFLKYLHQTLKDHGIRGGSLFDVSDKACSRLSFGKHDALKIYELMYNSGAFGRLFLRRKKARFDAFAKMRT